MATKKKKKDNGHDVYINNQWAMWVIGSLRTAKKEVAIYMRNQNQA